MSFFLNRFNVKAPLSVNSCYLLTPNSASTAKYAHNGELFANMQLSSVLSEDSAEGRLILTNCNTVLIAPEKTKGEEKRKVCLLNMIYKSFSQNPTFSIIKSNIFWIFHRLFKEKCYVFMYHLQKSRLMTHPLHGAYLILSNLSFWKKSNFLAFTENSIVSI